ncbi:MAG: ABC transporter ATP-binding protein [Chloroflexi bacterium]|nr:ABC transporter ATP-binding protein [Chloroflexota bacterium]
MVPGQSSYGRGGGEQIDEPAAIVVQGLVKRYGGRTVVDDVSFSVARGEVVALLGPNGAGKTTTVEILEGYRRPDAGTARVLGLDPARDARRLRAKTGLMLQQGGVFPQLTAREALNLFASFYPRSADTGELLALVGLADAAGTRFRQLSGGQKQRLSLALALVGNPELAFLDEPTAAMDPRARRDTWDVVRGLKERGCTVLLTTHFMDEAEHLADRVAILKSGRLVAVATPGELRQRAARRLHLTTDPAVAPAAVAHALGIDAASVAGGAAGTVVLTVDPTPALIARLTSWLHTQGALLTGLQAGSQSLEDAYLALTGSPIDGAHEAS